ncbi:MAG: non-canonical purine NTP pyrophosphatase [bacterium]
MNTIYFATTNPDKIQIAQAVCAKLKIAVKPVSLEVDEIQGEDPEVIVRDKALRAYQQLGMPVVVTDDSWDIVALKGFPGAYMKSVNYWFTPDDFLRLMKGVKNRQVILHQYLAYTDGNITEVFKNDIPGKIINEARGKSERAPGMTVTVFDSDNGKTLAEIAEQGPNALAERYKNRLDVWHEFLQWYKKSSRG